MRVARYMSRRKSLKNPAAVQLVATRTSPRDPSVKNPPHAAQLQQCVSISLCPSRILCHRVAMLAENMRAVAFAWFDLGTAGGWCNKSKLECCNSPLVCRLEFVSQIMGNVLNTCGTTGFAESRLYMRRPCTAAIPLRSCTKPRVGLAVNNPARTVACLCIQG